MSIITAYYRFEVLNEKTRLLNGIKSPNRLDCTAAYNPTEHGLLSVYQRKNGMLFFYLVPEKEMVSNGKGRAMYALGDGKQNLTSLYFEHPAFSMLCYGYPNGKELLRDGSPNPAAAYKQDAFLFICDWKQQVIELLVIQKGKYLIYNLYSHLLKGVFNEDLDRLRKLARSYYPYKWS